MNSLRYLSSVLFLCFLVASAFSGYNDRNSPPYQQLFTVHITTLPFTQQKQIETLVEELQRFNFPIYYGPWRPRAQVADSIYIRAGFVDSASEAQEIFQTLVGQVEYTPRVMQQQFVVRSRDQTRAIKTPTALWAYYHHQWYQVFDLSKTIFARSSDAYYTQPFISPNVQEITFDYGGNLYGISLPHLDTTFTFTGSYNSMPQRSPSGRWIGYIWNNSWEFPSQLWVIDSTGHAQSVIDSSYLGRSNAVKNFRWHPVDDRFFCVIGFAYGTVTVGGDIYLGDLDGNLKALTNTRDNYHTEVTMDLDVHEDTLFYGVAYHDSLYRGIETIERKFLIMSEY